jgi:hypothetical protein
MAQAPPRRRVTEEGAGDGVKYLMIEGREYPLDFDQMNGRRELTVWQEVGMSWLQIHNMLAEYAEASNGDGPQVVPLGAFAVVVWFVRDVAGDDVSLADILDSLNASGPRSRRRTGTASRRSGRRRRRAPAPRAEARTAPLPAPPRARLRRHAMAPRRRTPPHPRGGDRVRRPHARGGRRSYPQAEVS